MIANKVIGALEEINQNVARVKVLSFTKDGELIRDPKIIGKQFSPYGYVHSKNVFDGFDHNCIIEFQVYQTQFPSSIRETYTLDHTKKIKPVGIPLIPISNEKSVVDNVVYINTLANIVQVDFYTLYIHDKKHIYGPFKSTNGQVTPQTSTKVYKYKYNAVEVYQSGDSTFLIQKPSEQVEEMDCMTESQLATWFKDKLAGLNVKIEINSSLKQAFGAIDSEELNDTRFKRVLNNIETIYLTRDEIKSLAENSINLSKIYTKAVQAAEQSLKEEFIDGVENQKNEIVGEIKLYTRQLDTVKGKYIKAKKELAAVEEQLDKLSSNKERLIDDIRMQAEIGSLMSRVPPNILTYDEQAFIEEADPYGGLDTFIDDLRIKLLANGFARKRLAEDIIYQLKYKKFFLSNNLKLVLEIAKATGNCRVILQQVEPDWIKFEKLYENGLKQIWRLAHEHLNTIHLFILEDINISSIECYARPLQDLAEGIRQSLGGERTQWPANLWVVGIPFQRVAEYEFGLPLLKGSFLNWGAFPLVNPGDPDLERQLDDYNGGTLLPQQLYAHKMLEASSIDDYFIEK